MLNRVQIKNFKSIADLELEPGTVNVIIGENGCGKSNFLEAIAFGTAAEANKLENEFLASRGIRVTAPKLMSSAFSQGHAHPIRVSLRRRDGYERITDIHVDASAHFPVWTARGFDIPQLARTEAESTRDFLSRVESVLGADAVAKMVEFLSREKGANVDAEYAAGFALWLHNRVAHRLDSFLIYAPENSSLRNFAAEGQILPLGSKGDGLFKLLQVLSADQPRWDALTSSLKLFDWFGDIRIPKELAPSEHAVQVRDRYLSAELEYFDQRSANEGFLFLLFYFALFLSPDTPPIFAIDNIDTSLNPKMATALMRRLVELAKANGKQVFLTTHSPALLDGLDLTDDAQRLFVFHRNRKGETRARRVTPPQPVAGEPPVRLSEAFLRGILGGVPKNF